MLTSKSVLVHQYFQEQYFSR